MQKVSGKSDAEKVIYVYDYLKENLPKEKLSNSGYPRNCNGVYGALFGDGTGYVCATYACTIQRFMELANIPSYIIGGAYEKGEPNHAINVVRLSESGMSLIIPRTLFSLEQRITADITAFPIW